MAAQSALIALIAVLCVVGPRPQFPGRDLIAAACVLAGAAFAAWAARTLGSSLTVFPRPKSRARLVRSGPFRWVRNPIYAGLILFFSGCSLDFSWTALAPTAALAVLWAGKAQVEEGHLRARFPEYEEYAAAVRWRLVPYVY